MTEELRPSKAEKEFLTLAITDFMIFLMKL